MVNGLDNLYSELMGIVIIGVVCLLVYMKAKHKTFSEVWQSIRGL